MHICIFCLPDVCMCFPCGHKCCRSGRISPRPPRKQRPRARPRRTSRRRRPRKTRRRRRRSRLPTPPAGYRYLAVCSEAFIEGEPPGLSDMWQVGPLDHVTICIYISTAQNLRRWRPNCEHSGLGPFYYTSLYRHIQVREYRVANIYTRQFRGEPWKASKF